MTPQEKIKGYYSQELLDGVKPIDAETAEFLWNMMNGIGEQRMSKTPEAVSIDYSKSIFGTNFVNTLRNDTHDKTCMNCFHNYGVRHNVEFNPEDIVCEYWESDGLTKDDFCSRWKDKEKE